MPAQVTPSFILVALPIPVSPWELCHVSLRVLYPWFQVVCVPLFLACLIGQCLLQHHPRDPWSSIPMGFTASLTPGRHYRSYHNGRQERQPQLGEPALCLARTVPR